MSETKMQSITYLPSVHVFINTAVGSYTVFTGQGVSTNMCSTSDHFTTHTHTLPVQITLCAVRLQLINTYIAKSSEDVQILVETCSPVT